MLQRPVSSLAKGSPSNLPVINDEVLLDRFMKHVYCCKTKPGQKYVRIVDVIAEDVIFASLGTGFQILDLSVLWWVAWLWRIIVVLGQLMCPEWVRSTSKPNQGSMLLPFGFVIFHISSRFVDIMRFSLDLEFSGGWWDSLCERTKLALEHAWGAPKRLYGVGDRVLQYLNEPALRTYL